MDFDLDELRIVLEEMGYKDVPRDQLKNFAKDLKRLMKHDERAFRKGQSSSGSSATSFIQRLEAASSDSDKCRDTKEVETKDVKSKEAQEKQRMKQQQAEMWKRLKTDPVRLYQWYRTCWEMHHLK